MAGAIAGRGLSSAVPSAVVTPQITLTSMGGAANWPHAKAQVLYALGGCARQILAGELQWPRKCEDGGLRHVCVEDARLAAKIRAENWRGGSIAPPEDESTEEGRAANEAPQGRSVGCSG